jgi:hypothetical protein
MRVTEPGVIRRPDNRSLRLLFSKSCCRKQRRAGIVLCHGYPGDTPNIEASNNKLGCRLDEFR